MLPRGHRPSAPRAVFRPRGYIPQCDPEGNQGILDEISGMKIDFRKKIRCLGTGNVRIRQTDGKTISVAEQSIIYTVSQKSSTGTPNSR